MDKIFEDVVKAARGELRAALCIVTDTRGSTPRGIGAKMIIYENKTSLGTIGGGAIEYQVIEKSPEFCNASGPFKIKFDLAEDLEMNCGGFIELYIEPLNKVNDLYIFGGGHVGGALANLAMNYGFRITILDERPEIISAYNGLRTATIMGSFPELALKINTNMNSYIVVTTPQHKYDELITAQCAAKAFAYLGMIGSKRKVAMARKNFKEIYNLTDEQIDRIDMPIGIPFNAETPEEIAVSILAKLIDVRNSVRINL